MEPEESNQRNKVCFNQDCDDLYKQVLENPAKLAWMIQVNNPTLKIKSIKMKEKAPEGYVNDNRKFEVTLDDDSKIQMLVKIKFSKKAEGDFW